MCRCSKLRLTFHAYAAAKATKEKIKIEKNVKLSHLDSVNLQGNIGIGTKVCVKEQRMARAKQICILL